MSDVKILERNGKPAFAILPYEDYQALRGLAEDADDARALARFARRHAAGDEPTLPIALVDRLMAGEPPLRVWREHRGLSASALAATVGITPAHVSKLETGRGEPSISVLKRLSKALDADVDLLLGPK
jgi:DNA-binding XRE family transcriptional regulator